MNRTARELEIFRQRIGCAGYFFSVFAGVVLSVVLRDPIAAAVIPYIAAAWRSFAAGVWLFQYDQNRVRAWVCLIFYIANAFFLGAALALATLAIQLYIQKRLGQQLNAPRLTAVLISWFAGVILTSLIGIFAILAALKYKIRVWVNPSINKEVDDEFEQLFDRNLSHAGFNHAIFVIATSLFLPVLISHCLGLMVIFAKPPFGFVANVIAPFYAFVVMPAAMIFFYRWISHRIIANHPSECWNANTADDPANEL